MGNKYHILNRAEPALRFELHNVGSRDNVTGLKRYSHHSHKTSTGLGGTVGTSRTIESPGVVLQEYARMDRLALELLWRHF